MTLRLPTLAQIIAEIESSNNLFAIRFEPTVYFGTRTEQVGLTLLGRIVSANRCNLQTAKVIASSSWGAYQMMGFNLYSPSALAIPVIDPLGHFLADSQLQETVFLRFVEQNNKAFTTEELRDDKESREIFAKFYNGPGDYVNYANRILTTINKLTVNIPEQFA